VKNLQNFTGKGTYQLILYLDEEKIIQVGSLGRFKFLTGYYNYIGSAHGNGGLKARLSHHIKTTSKPHWHIDYLRTFAEVKEIWSISSEKFFEHQWAEYMLRMPGALFFINGFGSSDCDCISHLFYFKEYPSFESFQNLIDELPEDFKSKLKLN